MRAHRWKNTRVFTVGHSTRTLDELVAILHAFGVSVLVDIRTVPRSRHNPQFNTDALRATLPARKLRYAHVPELGGLRKARPDSPNAAWRNPSFRGYADYMQTEGFAAGLAKLGELAADGCMALMCAEAVPWRCHRSLVADALSVRGAQVEHISSAKRASPHRLTPFAHVEGTRVTYPGEPSGQLVTAAPFHLEATVRVLQRRPNHLVDVWEGGHYRRVLATSRGPVLVDVANQGSISAPDVRFSVVHGESPDDDSVAAALRRCLGLDVEPKPLQRTAAADPKLRAVARALRGMRPPRFASLFESVANVVPFQQVSLDAGVAVVRRLTETFSESFEQGDQRWYAFPRAEAIADAKLARIKAVGLSQKKAETLQRIARMLLDGTLSEAALARASSEEAREQLVALPGIGPWSAALIMLRGMGRLDVFPPGDAGAQRGLSRLLGVTPGPALERAIERAGDRRGYLYFCVLGSSLLEKGLITPAR